MPPKPKFSRAEIVEVALTIVREEGVDALTSRSIGARLGVTARPVFTEFKNMEEVQKETRLAANAVYNRGLEQAITTPSPFHEVGMHYFRFANTNPKLFELLFMRGHADSGVSPTLANTLRLTQGSYGAVVAGIQKMHGVTQENAVKLFQIMWLFVHGIACLQVTGTVKFTDDEVSSQITNVFYSLLVKLNPKGE